MTPPDRERRAREEVERVAQVSHQYSCARVKKVRGKWVIDRLVKCDCGESDKGNAMLDAYAEAVRQTERDRMARVVETLKVNHRNGCEKCRANTVERGANPHECINESRAVFGNAALDAVLTALAAPPEQEGTDGQ